MFYIKVNRVIIRDTHQGIIMPWEKGVTVNMTSFITTSAEGNMPVSDWLVITDKEQKKTALQKILSTDIMVNSIPPTKIIWKSNASIVFGDTGYIIHTTQDIPDYINWIFYVVKDNTDIRAAWTNVLNYIHNTETDKLIDSIKLILKTNPTASLGIIAAQLALSILAKNLSMKRDEILGMACQSFIRQVNYPYGFCDHSGTPDTTGNMKIDYTLFGFNPGNI